MRRFRRHRAGRVAAVLAAPLLVAIVPGAAQAADVFVQNGTLRYTSGQAANSVQVSLRSPGRLVVSDAKTNVTPGTGCTSMGARRASCTMAGVTALAIDVAGGADRVSIDAAISTPATIAGGGGTDVLRGGSGNDRLEGGPGADDLDGAAGNDAELGGDGDDTFAQGGSPNGADGIEGGGGGDQLVYGKRGAGVAVILDGAANDGEAGEGDNVGPDVESVSGGSGSDTIVGSAGQNRLEGGAGNDSVDGRAGADILTGGRGADSIGSRDLSADRVDCGADSDRVRGNPGDRVARDCEVVGLSAPIRLRPVRTRLAGTGSLSVLVTCSATAFGQCAGRVVVNTSRRVQTGQGRKRVRIGSKGFRLDPGTSEEIGVRVRPAARRLVRRHRRLVRATVRGGDAAGPAAGVARQFFLRR
jgi:RTX calcium-binding nonapeptide repeat (4 copies)